MHLSRRLSTYTTEIIAVTSLSLYMLPLRYLLEFALLFSSLEPTVSNHGLRGSASPVLTATGLVNGRWRFSTPYRIDTP